MKVKIVAGIVLVVLVVTGTYFTMQKQSSPELPTLSMRGGNANSSSEFLNAQKAVGFYRDEIQKHPEVVKNYVELAGLFVQEARVTGRHHEYLPKAQMLIDEALRHDPHNYEANIINAAMMMTRHQFAEAKETVEKCIAQSPHTAVAYGILCDANVELGNYDDAIAACDRMLTARPDLRSYSRVSYLRELHGDDRGAAEAMEMAADAGIPGQENRSWALYNLGKLFLNEGKLDTAEYIFKGILEERPDYAYAMSGLAQVERVHGNLKQSVDLLSKAFQITPEHLFVEQLADLYRTAGEKQNAAGVSKIVLSMFQQHEQGGWNVNREYAMFCANQGMNLPEALDRARKELDVRPNNIDVLDTYAWALFKNGKGAEAVPYIEQAMRLNTNNCIVHEHAALIYASVGNMEKANEMSSRSKNENSFVDTFFSEDEKLPAISSVASLH